MNEEQRTESGVVEDRLALVERRVDLLSAELMAATAGRDRAHEDISKLLEYFEFCLTEIGRLDGRIDSDVGVAVGRFERELETLRETTTDTSAAVRSMRSEQQAFSDTANDHAAQLMQLLADLQQFGVESRAASDAGIDEVAEIAEQLSLEIQGSREVADEALARTGAVELDLRDRAKALRAERQERAAQTDAANEEREDLRQRLESLREVVESVTGRDLVDRDDYATVLALAEELELAVGQSRVLADEALARTDSMEAAGGVRHDELIEKLAGVESDLRDRSDAVAASVSGLDNRVSEQLASLVAQRGQIRQDLLDVVDLRMDDFGSELFASLEARLAKTDSLLGELIPVADALAVRDLIDRDDYAVLVALAEELELAVGQSRALADEALARTDSVEAAAVERHEELVAKLDAVDGVNSDVALLQERLEKSDGLLAKLAPAVDELASRDLIDREDHAVLVALAEELELAVGESRVLAEKALERNELVDAAAVERHEELVAKLVTVEGDLRDGSDAVAVSVDGVNSDVALLQGRLEKSDGLLAKLGPVVDELSSRDLIDRDDYAVLVALAEELELAVGQSRALADEALARTDSVEAAAVERHEELVAKLVAVEDDLRDRSDAVVASVDGLDERVSERVESLVAEHERVRRDLFHDVDIRVGGLSKEYTNLRKRLEATDSLLDELGPAVDEISNRDVVSPEDYAALLALTEELEFAIDQSRVYADEALARTESFAESQQSVSERVESLLAEREQIRRDLLNDVDIRVGGLGSEFASLRERLEATDSLLGELGPAVDGLVEGKLVATNTVTRSDYDELSALTAELEALVAESRALADEALARTSVVEADVRNQTSSVIDTTVQNRHIVAQLGGVQAAIEALRSGSAMTEEDLAELREAINNAAEDSVELRSAIEESQEMSIKAADKAESAADHVDGLRADHDSEVETNKGREAELVAQLKRVSAIEEREAYERNRQRRMSEAQRNEFEQLVERLAEVERALEERYADQGSGSDSQDRELVIDLRREHAPPTWQFERRRTPRTPPSEHS